LAPFSVTRDVGDVAFVLRTLAIATLVLDDGIFTVCLPTASRILDADQHVGDGISHAH
jgi:hypothetical protein